MSDCTKYEKSKIKNTQKNKNKDFIYSAATTKHKMHAAFLTFSDFLIMDKNRLPIVKCL